MASVAQAPSSPSHANQASTPVSSSTSSSPASGVAQTGVSVSTATSSHPTASSPGTVRRMNSVKDNITTLVPSAINCSYAPCFCEENVWKICELVKLTNAPELSKCYTVFVSNQKQVVPLWRQKAGKDEEKLVIWDYHVIFLYKPDERCIVYDLDSDLPFPTYFHKYVTETFRTDAILNPEYHRFFRAVPASVFLQRFASDRRHMKKSDGSWMKVPPDYPCIQTPENKHNLDDFISMDSGIGFGEVMSLKDFVKRFYRN